jgi:hypothetical protein
MKKSILLFIALIIAGISYGQVGLGIRAGYGVTKLTKRPYISVESNPHTSRWVPAPTAGLVMDITVSDIFFLQLEAVYSGLGAEYDLTDSPSDETTADGSTTLREYFHLIEFPIVAKFATYDTKLTKFLEFGFNPGYFISGAYEVQNNASVEDKSGDYQFTHMKRGNFGFVVGVGIGTGFGKRASWALNLRYNHGVSDLNQIQAENNSEYVHNQTRALTLSFILIFF